MNKLSYFVSIITIIVGFALQSCQTVNKDKVKETIENFFTSYRNHDILAAHKIYPKMQLLKGHFRKSSSIDNINPNDIWVINDSSIIVNVTHHWVNPLGVDNASNMRFYIRKVGNDEYEIVNSKNFCMYDEMKLYTFALSTGAINLNCDTTDIAMSVGLSNAESMFYLAKQRVRNEIQIGLNVSMNWEKGYYNDYASGRGVVTNNTKYPIKNPRYTVTYYKRDDKTVVTSDGGIVCYYILMPNESKSFSWYTSYVGNAARAGVTVNCDEDWLDEITANLPFRGYEYTNFLTNGNWWPL